MSPRTPSSYAPHVPFVTVHEVALRLIEYTLFGGVMSQPNERRFISCLFRISCTIVTQACHSRQRSIVGL